MKVLFLDIASHQPLIACCNETSVLSLQQPTDRVGDRELIPLIETVLKEASLTYDDLTHIAAVAGPGGFTSLRIVAACANTIMDQLNIPSAGVHLSDLYQARASFDFAQDDTYWLHSTKRDQLFIKGGKWTEPSCELIENIKKIPADSFWIGELIDEHRTLVDEQGLQEAQLKPVVDILPIFVSQLSYNDSLIEPWYGREG